jgi:hypothetical protein
LVRRPLLHLTGNGQVVVVDGSPRAKRGRIVTCRHRELAAVLAQQLATFCRLHPLSVLMKSMWICPHLALCPPIFSVERFDGKACLPYSVDNGTF